MMKIKTHAAVCALALGLAACAGGYGAASDPAARAAANAEAIVLTTPPERDPAQLEVLFWSDAVRQARFRDMESWFAGHEVPPASQPRMLPRGEALPEAIQARIRNVMEQTNLSGLIVLDRGRLRFESYRLGMGPDDRWTSFSVAKSFTSTLLGAALKDGLIESLDDPVTRYIPELAGSAYDGVSVGQLATMTSGVKWNEDYADPKSDVAQMNRYVTEYGEDAIVAQMRGLEREAEPGAKWVYKTGETNLLGLLVENAVGMPLAQYARDKIVEPAGFEGGLFWMVDPRGGNIGGCCLSLRLSDYARMGQFVLEGGGGVVPEGWFAQAGAAQVGFGDTGYGYGYQWWTYPGAKYGAQGIFGQGITLVPDHDLVVAYIGNWERASGGPERAEMLELVNAIADQAHD